MLLQWKLSNNEVSPLNITYIVWLFTKIGRIRPVYEVVGCCSL